MIIFRGDTREIRVTIKQNDVQIDPGGCPTGARVWIFTVASGTVIGKWSMDVEDGFGLITVTDDDKLLMALSGDDTGGWPEHRAVRNSGILHLCRHSRTRRRAPDQQEGDTGIHTGR